MSFRLSTAVLLTWTALGAVHAETAAVSDTEVWNEGVEYYRAGDVINAQRVLKPLTASGEYKARAS